MVFSSKCYSNLVSANPLHLNNFKTLLSGKVSELYTTYCVFYLGLFYEKRGFMHVK